MMTKNEIAAALGIDRSTLRRWHREGCPHGTVEEVRKWRKGRKAKPKGRPRAKDNPDLRARLLQAQAEHYEVRTKLSELTHQIKTGELVELSAVEALLRRWYGPVWDQIKTMPDRLAGQVNPADPVHAREVLRHEVVALHRLGQEMIQSTD